MPWTHVYEKKKVKGKRQYRGFFINKADAVRWLKKQKDKKNLELSDERPVSPVGSALQDPPQPAADKTMDEGFDAALTATKQAKEATP